MNNLLHLTANDFRNIFREQILMAMFLFFPALLLGVGIWGAPALAEQYPEVEPYFALIGAFLLVETVLGIGYVISSIFLDEKDAQLLPVLRTVPLSMNTFVAYRILFGFLYLFGFSLLLINATSLIPVSPLESLPVAFICSLPTALLILLLTSLAGNKVEGLAIFKGINIAFLLPIVAFFVDESWKHVFGIFPTHWIYQYVTALVNGGPAWTYFVLGVVYMGVIIGGLWQVFRKKVFA